MSALSQILPLVRRHYPPAVFVLAFLFARLVGMRMHIPFDFFQFQAREWLQYDLWRSLLYLHSQPPLPNLWLGLALKLGWLTGFRPETLLLVLHFTAGLVAAHCIGVFTGLFIRDARLRVACNLLLLLHPVVYASMHQYFYTFHEWVILSALAPAIYRHFAAPSPGRFAVLACLVLLLALTRSLFHFVWALVLLALAAWPGRQAATPSARRAFTAVMLGSLVLLFAWPAKNLAVFGFFGSSSWQGANFAQGIVITDFPVPVEAEIPARFLGVPCVVERFKVIERRPTETLVAHNSNHYSLIETSRKLQKQAMDMIGRNPRHLSRKIAENYWAFTRFTGRQPHFAFFGMGAESFGFVPKGWMKIYELLLNQDLRPAETLKVRAYRDNPESRGSDEWLPSLFWLTFPLVVLLALVRAVVARGVSGPDRWTATVFVFTILWVLAMVLFIDGREGNRMRFSTEPWCIWLAFWLADGFVRRQVR